MAVHSIGGYILNYEYVLQEIHSEFMSVTALCILVGDISLMNEYTASSGSVRLSSVGLTNCTIHKIFSFRRGYIRKICVTTWLKIHFAVLWVMTPCSMVGVWRSFGVAWRQ